MSYLGRIKFATAVVVCVAAFGAVAWFMASLQF